MSFDHQNESPNLPGSERVGFCQNCGKPLNRDTIRVVGQAVYCEPCLEARLAGAPPFTPPAPGYIPVTPDPANPNQPFGFNGPLLPGTPNPALAALLGLIPGVGAMYNEQYAKGIVHLVIFAVLVSLSHAAGIFGIVIGGWVIYMAIEAHHTARARRDGTPLPNPFGFNDIGERLGFGRGWPAPGVPPVNPPYVPTSSAIPTTPPTEPNWGAPTDRYVYTPPVATPYPPYTPPQPGTQTGSQTGTAPYTQPYGYTPTYAPPYTAGYDPSYDPAAAPFVANLPLRRNRFPAGAIWLIALGTFFLIGNTGLFRDVPETALVGIGIIGLSIWVFISRMARSANGPAFGTSASLHDDGSPMYRVRVLRALRGSVWVLLVGVLLLLNSIHWIEWSRSWPYFIILAGVMALLERTAYNTAAAEAYQASQSAYQPGYPYPPANPTHVTPTTSTPETSAPEEGR